MEPKDFTTSMSALGYTDRVRVENNVCLLQGPEKDPKNTDSFWIDMGTFLSGVDQLIRYDFTITMITQLSKREHVRERETVSDWRGDLRRGNGTTRYR